MKNHIKNYIKIMGLAAVPFGTAQVHGDPVEYKVKVIKKETDTALHLYIGTTRVCETDFEQHYSWNDIILSKDASLLPHVLYRFGGICCFLVKEDFIETARLAHVRITYQALRQGLAVRVTK